MFRRRWVFAAGLALVIAAGACGDRTPPAGNRPKLVILGFDGMDPDLLKTYIDAGQMPTFKQLIARGGLYPLATTVSPESPTAWASFATGGNPGKHNIYDFLVRDTETYAIDLGMVRREPPTFLFDWIPTSRPKVVSLRGGTSFWVTAGQAGVRSSILTVPITFPPEDVPNGELLSGLPLPDIRGTMGTFYYFATDLSRFEEGNTEMGGILKRIAFEGDTAKSLLVGPPNPIVRGKLQAIRDRAKGRLTDADRTAVAELEAAEYVSLPLDIKWTRGSKKADITLGGERIPLGAGEWSTWVRVKFRINLFITVEGLVQLYLKNADTELQLYVSPVNFAPDNPPVPISSPASFAGDLYSRLGMFRTLGWAEATWPLNEDRMDEDTFMADLYKAFDDRAQVILDRLTKPGWDLLVGVIESTDRVQHMMYRLIDPQHPLYDAELAARHGDAILRVYRRADTFLAEVIEHLPPDTAIMIVSDHGFHSWRQAVNVNTWLVQNGYMVLQGQQPGEKKLDDLFGGGGEFWENVDWSRTRAYAMGLGQIYFNLRGREGQGIVSPGQEYTALANELSARLKSSLVDPNTGTPIVTEVYKRDDVYSGEFLGNAADLQVGFADGYRVSWQTTLGGAPAGLVYPNDRKWSGDHGGYDYAHTAGVLLTNRPISTETPRIIDIAPTVLQFYGVPIPGAIDGRPLFKQ
ncbi:MAG TPA: alkaline phosphatase family protein [Vicinamibacterales bacterium]|nr:alkaline phosphatase family protein [Vicinamibacterales bacterium]